MTEDPLDDFKRIINDSQEQNMELTKRRFGTEPRRDPADAPSIVPAPHHPDLAALERAVMTPQKSAGTSEPDRPPEVYSTPAIAITAAAGIAQLSQGFAAQAEAMLDELRQRATNLKNDLDQEIRDVEAETRDMLKKLAVLSEQQQQSVIEFAKSLSDARKHMKSATDRITKMSRAR
jgi:hypothetical protein